MKDETKYIERLEAHDVKPTALRILLLRTMMAHNDAFSLQSLEDECCEIGAYGWNGNFMQGGVAAENVDEPGRKAVDEQPHEYGVGQPGDGKHPDGLTDPCRASGTVIVAENR